MSDLRDRMAKEADFAERLSKLTTKQRHEVRDLLGNPPKPDRITEADWKRWEDERRGLLIVLLVLLASDSSDQHSREVDEELGGDGLADFSTEAREAAERWATKRGRDAAAEQIRNAREYFDDLARRWGEFAGEVPDDEFERGLTNLFGPANDARTAATETTEANSAGINAVVDAADRAGIKTQLTWYTEEDDRVCPVCRPLHGKPKSEWAEIIRASGAPNVTQILSDIAETQGPPAHGNCRCWAEIRILP